MKFITLLAAVVIALPRHRDTSGRRGAVSAPSGVGGTVGRAVAHNPQVANLMGNDFRTQEQIRADTIQRNLQRAGLMYEEEPEYYDEAEYVEEPENYEDEFDY
jgi:hypothetical protein